jgi:hypothetical protein
VLVSSARGKSSVARSEFCSQVSHSSLRRRCFERDTCAAFRSQMLISSVVRLTQTADLSACLDAAAFEKSEFCYQTHSTLSISDLQNSARTVLHSEMGGHESLPLCRQSFNTLVIVEVFLVADFVLMCSNHDVLFCFSFTNCFVVSNYDVFFLLKLRLVACSSFIASCFISFVCLLFSFQNLRATPAVAPLRKRERFRANSSRWRQEAAQLSSVGGWNTNSSVSSLVNWKRKKAKLSLLLHRGFFLCAIVLQTTCDWRLTPSSSPPNALFEPLAPSSLLHFQQARA